MGVSLMLSLQHTGVANATCERNARAPIGAILRYSEKDLGPEVLFWETGWA
jgi:hypothetical protein